VSEKSAWTRLEQAEATLKFHMKDVGIAEDDRPLVERPEVLAYRLIDPLFCRAYADWRAAREEVLREVHAASLP